MGILRDSQEEIRDALDQVLGLTGFVDAPSTLQPGVGFSRFVSMDGTGLPPGTFLVEWEIVVISGGTPETALLMIDERMGDIVNALTPVVHIRSVGLSKVETGSGPLFGVTMNCTKE